MKALMESFKRFINEEKMTSGEKKERKSLEKKVPKKSFTDRYGKKKGEEVYQATLTKMAMNEEEVEELEEAGKYDDGDGKDEKCDYVPCKDTKKKVKTEVVSEHLSYHIKNKLPLTESVFRTGSDAYIELIKEARHLWKMGGYEPKIHEIEILQSNIGQYGIYEGGRVPLDIPMLNDVELSEAKEKKNPPLNKPTTNPGGGKKWKVYVRDPKTGNVKKVTFGDQKGGLKGNRNDPEARASFAARHKCAEKKDKTKPGWWACRAHKYFGKNVPGRFW